MSIAVSIIDGPLADVAQPWWPDGAGAVVSFEGVVRPTEDDRPIQALDYEAYDPMATQQLSRLAQSVLEDHRLIAVRVDHSRGRVSVGRCSFRLRIASAHRKEAIRALDLFIDRLKQDVPIWKKPVFVEGSQADNSPPKR
jgi:molybdopterin synthase catalytic subunit